MPLYYLLVGRRMESVLGVSISLVVEEIAIHIFTTKNCKWCYASDVDYSVDFHSLQGRQNLR